MLFTQTYLLNTPLSHTWQNRLNAAKRRFPSVSCSRPQDSHKGTFGTLAIVGGSAGMSGAVVLAATSALYSGCGKVWAGFLQPSLPFATLPERPEAMLSIATELVQREDIQAWAVGCGLGITNDAAFLVSLLLQRHEPLLLDADALNLIATGNVNYRPSEYPRILTPHPAEAARLLGCTTAAIQQNRRNAALTLAERFQAIVVLKGMNTLITAPSGRVETNDSGNAGLASGGSGDVLSGIIGSLLAQGIPPFEAATAGVWLHGAAAEWLTEHGIGEIGMLAGELATAVRFLRNHLTTKAV